MCYDDASLYSKSRILEWQPLMTLCFWKIQFVDLAGSLPNIEIFLLTYVGHLAMFHCFFTRILSKISNPIVTINEITWSFG